MLNFIFLAAGMFALGCDDYIFAGLLPGISASVHSSVVAVAQGISIYGIAYVVALPACVVLLTQKSPHQVLLMALGVFIVGDLITISSNHLGVYLIGRGVAGLGAGLYLPLAIATAGELVGPDAKARALSIAWGSNAAGAVVGIPIGLALAERFGWRSSVLMVLVFSAIAWVGWFGRKLNPVVSVPPSLREQASLLADRDVLSVIGVTLLTATAGFGLYVYAAPVLEESATSPASALSLWNLGGLLGSLGVGFFVDRVGGPQRVMLAILSVMLMTFLLIPATRSIPTLGLLPFFIWGAMGWSTMTPQQMRLSEIQPGRDATLVALNSSAVSLGGVAGPVLGGLALKLGLSPHHLPDAAACVLFFAWLAQVSLVRSSVVSIGVEIA